MITIPVSYDLAYSILHEQTTPNHEWQQQPMYTLTPFLASTSMNVAAVNTNSRTKWLTFIFARRVQEYNTDTWKLRTPETDQLYPYWKHCTNLQLKEPRSVTVDHRQGWPFTNLPKQVGNSRGNICEVSSAGSYASLCSSALAKGTKPVRDATGLACTTTS